MSTSHTIAYAELQKLRRSLAAVTATNRSTTNAAMAAVKSAREAYLLLFTSDEQLRVIDMAVSQRNGLFAAHFLHTQPPITTFEQAVAQFGTQIINAALGDQA